MVGNVEGSVPSVVLSLCGTSVVVDDLVSLTSTLAEQEQGNDELRVPFVFVIMQVMLQAEFVELLPEPQPMPTI